MTTTVCLALLAVFAGITSAVTEGIKNFLKWMKVRYASNVVALVVAVIVGVAGTALYYVDNQIPFDAQTSIYLAVMGLANWIGSMVGYDKVKQAVSQIGEIL